LCKGLGSALCPRRLYLGHLSWSPRTWKRERPQLAPISSFPYTRPSWLSIDPPSTSFYPARTSPRSMSSSIPSSHSVIIFRAYTPKKKMTVNSPSFNTAHELKKPSEQRMHSEVKGTIRAEDSTRAEDPIRVADLPEPRVHPEPKNTIKAEDLIRAADHPEPRIPSESRIIPSQGCIPSQESNPSQG
jgi:hypothetical protein